MSKDVSVKTERVDDIPLLFAELKRMGVQELVDKYFPAHGNRQGLSMGEVAVVWLSHILSQADHRMNHVQNWVENHIESIGRSLPFDFSFSSSTKNLTVAQLSLEIYTRLLLQSDHPP